MNYDYGLLDSFYLSEDSITGKILYPSGIYRIIYIFDTTFEFSLKYVLYGKFLSCKNGMTMKFHFPISQHSLETMFKLSLIEEYEYYEIN